MPKVFGLHEVELPPGVTPEEYEQVFGKGLASLPDFEGWKSYLLKGDRGERAGKYLLLFEMESVGARDRYYPSPDEESEEARRFAEQHPEALALMEKYAAFLSKPHSATDYVVIGGPSS
jgi:hypothetical protein